MKKKKKFNKLNIEELNNLKFEMQRKFGLVGIDKADIKHYYKTGRYYSNKK